MPKTREVAFCGPSRPFVVRGVGVGGATSLRGGRHTYRGKAKGAGWEARSPCSRPQLLGLVGLQQPGGYSKAFLGGISTANGIGDVPRRTESLEVPAAEAGSKRGFVLVISSARTGAWSPGSLSRSRRMTEGSTGEGVDGCGAGGGTVELQILPAPSKASGPRPAAPRGECSFSGPLCLVLVRRLDSPL
jgi:hypothetical protein